MDGAGGGGERIHQNLFTRRGTLRSKATQTVSFFFFVKEKVLTAETPWGVTLSSFIQNSSPTPVDNSSAYLGVARLA